MAMFSIYPDLLLSNPLYLSKREFRTAFLRHKDKFHGRILDIGCGRKPFKDFLDNDQYVSLDYKRENNPNVCAAASSLPFENESFDTVLCAETLEHVAEPSAVLSECCRIMRPGGVFYMTVPMTWYLHYEPNDFYRFTKYGIRYLCEKAGFVVISIERMGGFMFYICLRLSEFLNALICKYIFLPLALFGIRIGMRRKLATIILIPYQLLALMVIFLFDRFSPRDARGWVILAKRQSAT